MKKVYAAILLLFWSSFAHAGSSSLAIRPASGADAALWSESSGEKHFDHLAEKALVAMRKRAEELKVGGVAVVAYFEGDSIRSWSSKMIVVGRLKDEPTQNQQGSNLLAIAYSKASEMADTLKDSGSHVRPSLTGEFGWKGGVIARGKKGCFIAAFSGGKDNDDVSISQAGIEQLKTGL